jgi:predicted nucleotidyltransferase
MRGFRDVSYFLRSPPAALDYNAFMTTRSTVDDPVVADFLHEISPVRDRIRQLILFGSRARGDNKPYSDYDILVVLPEKDRCVIDALYDATQAMFLSEGLTTRTRIRVWSRYSDCISLRPAKSIPGWEDI